MKSRDDFWQEYTELLKKYSDWLCEGFRAEDPDFEGEIDLSPESFKEARKWFDRMREIEKEHPEFFQEKFL
jgi:rubrerythrin